MTQQPDIVERPLIALLLREGLHSGVWFASRLTEAAHLLANQDAEITRLRARVEQLQALALDEIATTTQAKA